MSFHETPRFPDDLSIGTAGGPGYSTAIVALDSGAEQRVGRWELPLRRYDIAYKTRTLAQIDVVLKFFIARQGALHGFRFKDCQDFTTASDHRSAPSATDGILGIGDGSETVFQMAKTYTSGATSRTRNIEKPVVDTSLVSIDDVTKTEGVDWTIDTVTGKVTFTVAPATDEVVKGGSEFDVPVRFSEGADAGLSTAYVGGNTVDLEGFELVEIRDELLVDEDFNYGGAAEFILAADISISVATGRALKFTCNAAGLTVTIPSPGNLPAGGPFFYVFAPAGNTESFNIESEGAVGVVTVDPGDRLTLIIELDGALKWVAI